MTAPTSVMAKNAPASAAAERVDARSPDQVQAVILAAGRGSRLEGFTAAAPKCLVRLGGVPLLEHQLRLLEMLGIDRVSIVVGYRADSVRDVVRGAARLIRNDEWRDTNSLYSLSLCREYAGVPLLVMNCDVLVHPVALQRLLNAPGSAFLYDSSSGDSEEHMKVELKHGCLAAMSKALPAHRSHGENVGALYFDAAATRLLFREVGKVLNEGHRRAWMAMAVERLARWSPLHGIDVADLPWTEIDFPGDLEWARAQVWRQLRRALAPAMRLAS
jgi:choline kinase